MTSTIHADKIMNSSGDQDSGVDLQTNDQVKLKTANTDRVTVTDATTTVANDVTVSRAETNGTVRLNLSNTGANGSSEYSELKLNSTAGGTQTSVIQHRNNYGLNIGTTTDHPVYFLQNNTAAMSIDASGHVLKSVIPRFSVYKSNSEQYINVSNSGSVNVPITWGTADTNVGNHFNTSTDRFTAPVTGTYRFDWAILTGLKIPSSGVYWIAYFTVKNGGSSYLNRTPGSPYTYAESYNSSGSSSAGEVTNSVGFKKIVGGGFADLTAGDYIQLMAQCSNNSNVRVHSGVHSTFSGYLIG